MAIAGKVAITLSTENGGAWSADVTYDRLVAVKHNNNLYISRKTVANVEPPNDEFWFLALEGFGGEDVEVLIDRMNELSDLIQAIINGTTQVGNAKTLDGHGAEYFAPLSDLSGAKILTELPEGITNESTMQELIDALPYNSILVSSGAGNSNHKPPLLPKDYSGLIVFKPRGVYTIAFTKSQYDNFISVGGIGTNNKWQGWNELNLANYLPLTGGTVEINSFAGMRVKRSSNVDNYYAGIMFANNNGDLCGIASDGTGKLLRMSKNGSEEGVILHTGNKPTGTYTGNGSTATREFAIKSTSDAIAITSSKGVVLVFGTVHVAIGIDGKVTGGTSVISYNGTTLIFYSDSPLLNSSGLTYKYYSI